VDKSKANLNPWTLSRASSSKHINPSTTESTALENKSVTQDFLKTFKHYDDGLNSKPTTSQEQPACSSSLRRKHTPSPQRDNITVVQVHPSMPITSSPTYTKGAQQPHTPSKHIQDADLPSPSKRRLSVSKSEYSPVFICQNLLPGSDPAGSQPVNRRLEFTSPPPTDASSSPSMPSPSAFRGPGPASNSPVRRVRKDGIDREIIDLLSSRPSSPGLPVPSLRSTISSGPKNADDDVIRGKQEMATVGKRYIMLRDSLPGAWKEVDEAEVPRGRNRAWRRSQVETLDLTGN